MILAVCKKYALLLAGTWLFMAPAPLIGANYYVALSGSDQNTGSQTAPFRTIRHAISRATQPGDMIYLRGGVYYPDRTLNMTAAGANGRPITLRGYPGETAIIDGTAMASGQTVLAILSHFIQVKDITVRNAKGSGVVAFGPGQNVHHILIENCTVRASWQRGIFIGNQDPDDPPFCITVRGCRIEGNVLRNQAMPRVSWDFGGGAGNARAVHFVNNRISGNYGEGLGFFLCEQVEANGNLIWDNYSVNLYLNNTTHAHIRNNRIFSTLNNDFYRFGLPATGIQAANEFYPYQNPSAHLTIVNNLLWANGVGISYGAYQLGGGLKKSLIANNTAFGAVAAVLQIQNDPGHRNTLVANNIWVQVQDGPMAWLGESQPGISYSHNLWWGGLPPSFAQSSDDLFEDPFFGDPLGADGLIWTGDEDFLPAFGAPVIDAGMQVRFIGPETQAINQVRRVLDGDMNGQSSVDLGAFEKPPCLADLNVNGIVDRADLAQAFGLWHLVCSEELCLLDLNQDRKRTVIDLIQLLSQFGPCP